MSILKTILAGAAALSLIAAPVIADTHRVSDRLGVAAEQETDDLVPAAILISVAVLAAIVVATSSDDDSESD